VRNRLDLPVPLQQAAVVTLVSLVAYALARDARSTELSVEPGAGDQKLSTRVSAIVERMRVLEPTLLRDLPPELKIAQWRNHR
jgi:hypothetical protein